MRVSSSGVRTALAAGDFRRARDLLGRAYSMRGRVVAGEQLGRRLGLSDREHPHAAPQAADDRHLRGARARRRCACTHTRRVPGWRASGSGPRWMAPSRCSRRTCSISTASLYGRELEVEFVAKIRDEEKFASLDALVQQMHQDAAQARELLSCKLDRRRQVADYKSTINLPETGFPMKADLAQREPKMLAAWESQRPVREDSRHLARAVRASCCTTARRTPTARRTSATSSTRCSRTSWSSRITLDGYDSPYVPGLGLPRPAHRAPGREEARPRRRQAQREGIPRRLPQVRAASRWTCSAPTSSASACSATGIVRT